MPEAPTPSTAHSMRTFVIIWIGQVASMLGSAMTTFALAIWAFERTGRATDLALISFFYMAPLLVTAPFIGVLVDRHNRKLMMMLSDLASGLLTIAGLILLVTDLLQVWHLFIISMRSEEHTSELQSRENLVCRLLLEK